MHGGHDLHEHKLSELLASIRYHRPNYTVSVEHLYRDNLTSLVTIRGSVFPQAASPWKDGLDRICAVMPLQRVR